MKEINRAVALIKPKKPFFEWKQSLSGAGLLALPTPLEDSICFLIPVFESYEEGRKFLEKNFKAIFQHGLSSLNLDQTTWPQKLSLDLFNEWFDVDICAAVIDIADHPIEAVEFEL